MVVKSQPQTLFLTNAKQLFAKVKQNCQNRKKTWIKNRKCKQRNSFNESTLWSYGFMLNSTNLLLLAVGVQFSVCFFLHFNENANIYRFLSLFDRFCGPQTNIFVMLVNTSVHTIYKCVRCMFVCVLPLVECAVLLYFSFALCVSKWCTILCTTRQGTQYYCILFDFASN